MDLRNIFKEMMKLAVIIVVSIIIFVILAVIIVRTIRFFKYFRVEVVFPKKQITAVYNGVKGESDIDTIWCGTFDLAWNELIEKIGTKVEFENYESDFANRLNEQTFTKDMLPANDYYIKTDKSSPELKEEILQNVNNKFGKDEKSILDGINFEVNENKMTVYSMLNKKFDFSEKFYDLGNCFGIPAGGNSELYKNLEVMYCREWTTGEPALTPLQEKFTYAVKIKATEDEEIIFVDVKADASDDLEKLYEELMFLEQEYKGSKEFKNIDEFIAPYIKIDAIINYEELCGKEIKGTDGLFLENAIQSINFSINPPNRDKVHFKVNRTLDIMGNPNKNRNSREFNFCNYNFSYVFLKKVDKDKPYLLIKLNENFVEIVN